MKSELRTVSSLASLYAIRMLGLFMVLPVLSVSGMSYEGATAALLGLALGIYGLTQACFQIPLGLLSDLIGRKPVIVLGLVLFAIGSVVAATAESVSGLILGRALQGSGAIASTIMALVADLTSEENRTKAMAAIGASIGLSFTLALVLGPALSALVGLSGLFYLAFALSVLGMALVFWVVPNPQKPERLPSRRDSGAIPSLLGRTFIQPELARLNAGIFALHACLTALFVVLPLHIVKELGLAAEQHWWVYCPVLVLSFIAMVPLMIVAEKRRRAKEVFLFSILVLALALFAFTQAASWQIIVILFFFFVAFNLLEAMLPSLVSKLAPAGSKGTAMGIYSTSQFLGAFLGGALGGLIVSRFDSTLLFLVCSVLCVCWLVIAVSMSRPRHLSSMCFQVSHGASDIDFSVFDGVEESVFVADDGLLYLKVDKNKLDLAKLKAKVEPFAV